MSDNPNPETDPAPSTETPDAAPVETPPATTAADVEKWRTLARKHERDSKARAKELDELKASQLSDSERAIEAARSEGRSAAMNEVGARLAGAELRAQAATAGAQLPDLDYLNVNRFVNASGDIDADAITAFVESLPKAATPTAVPEFAQDLGLGRQPKTGPVMDPTKLAAMVREVSPF